MPRSIFFSRRPGPTIDFSASGAAKLFILMWNQVALYPKGWPAADRLTMPSLTLPNGWKFNTALPVASQSDNSIKFSPVKLSICSSIRRCRPANSRAFIR